MSIQSQVSEDGKILTIAVSERFDISVYKDFSSTYADKLDQVSTCVIDMAKAEFLDSSALGMLLMLRERATAADTTVKIANCSPGVMNILKMANLDKLFLIEE